MHDILPINRYKLPFKIAPFKCRIITVLEPCGPVYPLTVATILNHLNDATALREARTGNTVSTKPNGISNGFRYKLPENHRKNVRLLSACNLNKTDPAIRSNSNTHRRGKARLQCPKATFR
jgi:hypothetical protein